MRPACTIQIPALLQESSSRRAWAAPRFTGRARQARVREREESASQSLRARSRIWLARFIEAEAPEQLHEVIAGGADGVGVPRHLDEPGAARRLGEAGEEALAGRAVAREVGAPERPPPRPEHLW